MFSVFSDSVRLTTETVAGVPLVPPNDEPVTSTAENPPRFADEEVTATLLIVTEAPPEEVIVEADIKINLRFGVGEGGDGIVCCTVTVVMSTVYMEIVLLLM
jgi:hypothetical protein